MDGGGVSAATIEVLLQSLINVFKEERSLLRGLDGDAHAQAQAQAQLLQRTLKTIQGLLNDAEEKSITSKDVQIWLRKLEALAFDADNDLDELSYHLLHNKMETQKTPTEMETEKAAMSLPKKVETEKAAMSLPKKVETEKAAMSLPKKLETEVLSVLNLISRRQLNTVTTTIKQINSSFENMNKRATELGLQNKVENDAPAAAALNASDSSPDPIFIGKDDDVTKLVEMLTQTHPQEQIFSILALVGEGGTGKTTLIKKVFNHEKIKAQFRSHIWLDASQTFDPIIIFNKILSTFTSHTGGGVELGEVILIKLQEALKHKTYLLVLDDVSNEDVLKWEVFINWLSAVTSTEGNGIIITTRHEKVASIINPLHIHLLKRLSDGDCWSIIEAKAFKEGEASSDFEMIGRKIAKRCQGLALAANVVGGVLRGKSKEEWPEVEKKISSSEDSISKILRLGYDNLSSPSLKKCFTYCSIFPQGRRIVKQELIELWMAEGFLQPNGENDMESVGDKFFNILVQNSLLQVAEKDGYGNVESCMMHYLVHTMASSVLGSSNDADGGTQTRYMILKEEESGIPKKVAKSAKHLRTLFLEGEIPSINMFSEFQSLRNLTLTSVEELPDSIRKLIHLRNLNISKSWIRELPESIGELRHLQTLRAYTKRLLELPSGLKYLINLRHLYIFSQVKLPAEMRRLTCLQTLRHFAVGDDEGYRIQELGALINLKGKLHISNLEKVKDKEEAEKAVISGKPNLFDLVFEWDEDREGERDDDENVLEGLQPHANANLKKLEIYGFKGKRFPEWIEKMAVRGPQASWIPLQNLTEITLSFCSECEKIPQLEGLPNLESLSLIGLKKVKFINSSFNNLTSLYIEDLEGLEYLPDWLFYKNQNLSELVISGCPKLSELPNGVGSLNSLEELSIRDCRNLMWKGLSQGMLPNLKLKIEGCRTTAEELSADASDKLQLSDIKDCPELHAHSDWPNEFTYNGTSSAAIEVLLQNIINALKVAPIRDLDAQQLEETVRYLNDAEKKSITQGDVKFWLWGLEALAFDADTVVDARNYHLLSKKVHKMKTLKDKVPSSLNPMSCLHNITVAHQVQPIIGWGQLATKLGLQAPAAASPGASSETNSFPFDPIFIGRVKNVHDLVEELTNIKEPISILAIHGVGGVGKTTLTREVFNHERIKARFGSHIWVLVPRIFDPVVLLSNILSSLLPQTSYGGVENEERILKQLKQALKGRVYLLVLDDVWIEDSRKWDKFFNSMSSVTCTKGNAVIITTRKDEVASMVRPHHNHPLKGLSYEDCWSIIKEMNRDAPPEYESIGRKICSGKICFGLPLIVNVVGGMLRGRDWDSINQDTEGCHMFDFLRLSYDNLSPPSLKKCFTYCSIFPKGRRIVKQELIELWMAEGFLGKDDMESVGDKFFNMLLQNSLLQVAERDNIGNVESCVMHDLVHDLASAVLKSSLYEVRYLFHGDADSSCILKETAKYLRTLILQGEITDEKMFWSFKSLHVLTLDSDQVKELPSSIGKLIYLRNLNISRTRIEYLPDWICDLRYLQTLHAFTESLRKVPSTLKYLISLRHLYLCHGVELPAHIGRLTNLQALNFRVGKEKGYKIEELGSLNNLRHLSIYNLEEVCDEEEARKANISQKPNLSELSFNFEWAKREGERDDKSVLEGLQPHAEASIKKLEIRGFTGKTFPEWMAVPVRNDEAQGSCVPLNNVIQITLFLCSECEKIPQMGLLPNLKCLSLRTLSNVTSISSLYGDDRYSDRGDIFPALETLSLTDMAELENAELAFPSDEVKVFPRLKSLKIYRCNKLKCLPSWLFGKAVDLKELDIRQCSKLSKLPDGLHALNSLESMTIKGCQNLNSIANSSGGSGSLTSLRSLEIRDCQKLKAMVEPLEMPLLQKVYMAELKSLENLHKFLDCLAKSPLLIQLRIVGVPKFISTPDVKIMSFGRLQKLEINLTTEWSRETSVTNTQEIVNGILQRCSSSLGELILSGPEIWGSLPESIQHLQGLYNLELENFGVKELPAEWLKGFKSLERLCLSTFTKLRHLPSMKSLQGLQEFHIRNCPKLRIENEGHKIPHHCTTHVNGHLLNC